MVVNTFFNQQRFAYYKRLSRVGSCYWCF